MPLKLLVNPLLIAMTVGTGWLGCRLAGVNPHPREMALAAMVGCAASVAAMVTLWFARGPGPTGPAQGALLAMVTHLFMTIALSVVSMLAGVASEPFAFWTLGVYWVALLGLSVACIRVVRAPLPPPTPGA